MTLDLFRLFVFVTVVDRNGYSAAARYLHLGQPTVSHHVSELQRTLNTELLRYEQRAIYLTAAGHEVYRSALLMLREQDSLRDALKDLKDGRRGRVRLGASIALEQRYFVDQVIAPFCRSHRGILLSLQYGHSAQHARAVLDRDLDIAYVIKWQLPTEAYFELLYRATLTFFVSRGHPLAEQSLVRMEEIAEVGLITAPFTGTESLYYSQVLRDSGLTGNHSVLEIDGLQARVLATEAGLGVMATFIPKHARGIAVGSLVPLSVDRPPTEVEIGLVRRRGETGSESIDALAAWLRDHISG